jgi:acetyl-CoA C-acetyltransferase
MNEAIIISGARTPIGSFHGALNAFSAPQLGSFAIKEAVRRAGVDPAAIDEVIMGCVLQGGMGQAPARQAMKLAGLPNHVGAMTINKVCGSGLKSIMLGAQAIKTGDSSIVVAGGMESMTNTPYYLMKARTGFRMGHEKVLDGMIFDGLWDPYTNQHMGNIGEICAKDLNIPRAQQDQFAKRSYEKAHEAIKNGWLKDQIVPIEIKDKKGNVTLIDQDEEPGKLNIEKGLGLKPAFDKEGTITAFNASKINDGAAAVVLTSKTKADELGLKPMAKIVAYATHSQEPDWFTTAPAYAIDKVCKKAGLSKDEIDLFEINEAFSVVSCAVNQITGIDESKVNITGGAVAFGHPIGASGANLMVSMLYNLRRTGKRYGLVTLCIGGGEAVGVIIERL